MTITLAAKKVTAMNIYLLLTILVNTVFFLAYSIDSNAGVRINGTRFVYLEGKRSISVQLTNTANTPALVQLWIDDGNPDATPEESNVPFFITPPINRIDGGKGQSVRVRLLPHQLPTDTESVFWLNVLEIPPKPQLEAAQDNFLQMSIRSRIKIFYRPKEIQKKNAIVLLSKLRWKKDNDALRVFNPTAFHFSFARVEAIIGDDQAITLPIKNHLLSPMGDTTFAWPLELASNPDKALSVRFYTINDYGSSNQTTTQL